MCKDERSLTNNRLQYSYIIKLRGQIVLTYLTNIVNNILKKSRFLTVSMKQK